MTINEESIHNLLDLTRMYINIPVLAIFEFVARENSRNLQFFDTNILDRMYGRFSEDKYVMDLLLDIRKELE